MKPKLSTMPEKPEFNNSVGRLISLINLVSGGGNYLGAMIGLYDDVDSVKRPEAAAAVFDFAILVATAYQEAINDLKASEIADETKQIIFDGLKRIPALIYPAGVGNAIQTLNESEISVLKLAASLLDKEESLVEADADSIRDSIANLRSTIESASDLPRSAKRALLEICLLSSNALEQYTIYGAKGFRKAFKSMLAELMEVYLEQGAKNVEDKSWWKDAVQHARIFDALAAKLAKYKPLLEGAGKLFLGD